MTSGRQIATSGAAMLLFAVIGWLAVRQTESSHEWYRRRSVRLWNHGVLLLVAVGGIVAVAVGLVVTLVS
jgi:hypothetical protein